MNYNKWITVLINLPILVAAFYALLLYKKSVPAIKVFRWFIFLTLAIQIPYTILALQYKTNLPLLHLHVWLGFVILCLFYRTVLRGFINTAIITTIAVLFSCFTIVNSIFIQPFNTSINSYALTTEAILIVILSLTTFIVSVNDAVKVHHEAIGSSLRWINSGLFIYYASTLLLFYFGDIMQKKLPGASNRFAWQLNCFFLIIMYLCFIIALWKQPKKSIS